MYNEGKSLRYIGNIVGVSPSTINNILDKNNIQRRQKNYKILNSFNIDEQQLKGFLELEWSYRKIARFFKTDHHTIKRIQGYPFCRGYPCYFSKIHTSCIVFTILLFLPVCCSPPATRMKSLPKK